jgi:hypothetical protein
LEIVNTIFVKLVTQLALLVLVQNLVNVRLVVVIYIITQLSEPVHKPVLTVPMQTLNKLVKTVRIVLLVKAQLLIV